MEEASMNEREKKTFSFSSSKLRSCFTSGAIGEERGGNLWACQGTSLKTAAVAAALTAAAAAVIPARTAVFSRGGRVKKWKGPQWVFLEVMAPSLLLLSFCLPPSLVIRTSEPDGDGHQHGVSKQFCPSAFDTRWISLCMSIRILCFSPFSLNIILPICCLDLPGAAV